MKKIILLILFSIGCSHLEGDVSEIVKPHSCEKEKGLNLYESYDYENAYHALLPCASADKKDPDALSMLAGLVLFHKMGEFDSFEERYKQGMRYHCVAAYGGVGGSVRFLAANYAVDKPELGFVPNVQMGVCLENIRPLEPLHLDRVSSEDVKCCFRQHTNYDISKEQCFEK